MAHPPLHSIDLKALRVFCEIVESGGFTAAQIKLNASQPVMSNQIRLLEERLKVRLCERGRRGFKLTDEGKVVYQAAQDLFVAMENFRTVISSDASELSGELRVSLIDNIATNPDSKIVQAINQLRRKAPGVRLALSIGTTVELETAVMDGSRDMAIGYFHHRLPGLVYQPLFKEIHNLYCSKDHPAAGLTGDALIRQLERTELIEGMFLEENLDPDPVPCNVVTTSANEEIKAIQILSGGYVGFLPIGYAQQWITDGKLVTLDPERYFRKVDFHLLTSQSRPRRLVATAFIDELVHAHRTTARNYPQ